MTANRLCRLLFVCQLAVSLMYAAGCNQSKPVGQSDVFWQRGKIRGHFFGLNPDDLSIQDIQANDINLVGAGYVSGSGIYLLKSIPEPDTVNQFTQSRLTELRQMGIKAVVSTSLIRVFWEDLFQQYPEAREHVVLSPDGKPQLWRNRPGEMIANLLDPFWLDLHKKGILCAIKTGYDAIHLDNPLMIFSYDEQTQALWTDYLSTVLNKRVTTEEALRIEKPKESEVGEELLGDIPILYQDAEKSTDPVVEANLEVFRYSNFLKFLRKLKDAANEAGGIKFDFTAHMGPKDLYYWTEGRDVYDIICIENSQANTFWFEPESQGLVGFMIAYACSNEKPSWVTNNLWRRYGESNRQLEWQLPPSERNELYIAETAAMGGMLVPKVPITGYVRKFNKQFKNYGTTLKKYFSFQKEQEYYFTETSSPANVAILLSHMSYIYNADTYKKAMFGIAEFLLKNHVPFDIKIIENEESLTLDKYSALIACHLAVAEDAVIEKVLARVSDGASLFVVGELGTRQQNFLPHPGPILQKKKTVEILSRGHVTWVSSQADELYQKFHLPYAQETNTEWLEYFHPLTHMLRVSLESDRDDLAVVIPSKKDNKLILQCLNYHFHLLEEATENERLNQERVLPLKNLLITISRELMSDVKNVTAYVPGQNPLNLRYESNNETISIHMPELNVYAMIVCE